MICTNDLVEPYEFCNVHPKNKRDVGYRLAFMALNKTYGMKEIACQSPQYESMEIRDGKARIRFKYMDQGFNRMADIRGFEICGADKVFYPADAVVENQFAFGRFVGESAGTRGRALLFPRFPAGQSGRYPRTAGRSFPYGRFLSLLTVGIAGPGPEK